MTSYTMEQARDAVVAAFEAGWAIATGDTVFENIKYTNRPDDPPNDEDVIWCRFIFRHSFSNKASLSGSAGTGRFERQVLLTIQLFLPYGNGIDDATPQAIVDIFEGGIPSLPGVWFRNVTPNEIGDDGIWYQTNVTADIIYDQIK